MITKSILGVEKNFSDVEELKSYVKENLTQIIDSKKVEQKSCDKGTAISCKVLNGSKLEVAEKAIKTDDNYWYIAVNTTMILDSHQDLHDTGIWNTTIKDNQGRNYLVADHSLTLDATIVKKEYIEIFVAKTTFASLGMPYDGSTQVLVYKFPKDRVIHEKAKEWLESGDEIQASVRMQYINIQFALDSNHPDDEKEKKRYDEYIDKIANKADFEYIPYFFIIKEAKNVRESSLVLFGSNSITGNIIQRKTIEPSQDTQKNIEELDNPQEQLLNIKKSNYFNTL